MLLAPVRSTLIASNDNRVDNSTPSAYNAVVVEVTTKLNLIITLVDLSHPLIIHGVVA
jgi:hypothetical protein